MKITFISVSILLAFLSFNCGGTDYQYWDVSMFHMDSAALSDTEEIKILYASGGPDDNKNKDYYYHFVAISQLSGDTVNVLSIFNSAILERDKNNVFNYFNMNNHVSKLIYMGIEKSGDFKHQDDLDSFDIQTNISKVARDPNFDYIARNNYPTVIGVIGAFESNSGL